MTFLNRTDTPFFKKVSLAIKTFSFTELGMFSIFLLICLITGLSLMWTLNTRFLVDVPHKGGSLVEGIIGSPRFINPLLAISDADEDITSLIYSGILKATLDGNLINDLANELTISEDGLEYTVVLKDNVYFHDGEPVTTDDIEFTIKKAQDSLLKSPKRLNWIDVTTRKESEKKIIFTLKQPYSPFIENLTMGILPEHMWENLDSDQFSASIFNTEPIGSGPYTIKKIKRSSGGLPILYELAPFDSYALGEPYIKKLILRFYSNEDDVLSAYEKGNIESLSSVPPQKITQTISNKTTVEHSPLPRVFGVFFNQNRAPIFIHKEVRVALNTAIDKERIVQEVLSGYGNVPQGPVFLESFTKDGSDDIATTAPPSKTDAAISILTKAGWVLNPETGIMEKKIGGETTQLAFSVSTSNVTELKATALILQEEWRKIGAEMDIKVFETSNLNQDIIRPRKYDALLFGEIIGRDFDLYPFWHSSQRNDPGLNIAMYTNISADKLLEEIRLTTNIKTKIEKYKDFEKLILEDAPAIFIYTPDFIYLVPRKINNLTLGNVTTPSERFMNVHDWYVQTNKVWKVFVKNN